MKKEYKRGFTLIEIIAVIVIIGILALITVPAISQYIKGSQETTYETYETNMKNAVRNMIVDCIKNNETDCQMPDKNQKTLIYLDEVIEKGYISDLKDPKTDGECSSVLSYIEIENTGSSDYEYNACLYCGSYKTDNENCVKYASDGDMPTCGENTTGESTKWTNQDRTITVPCLDSTSGCTKNEFSKTFSATTDISNVTKFKPISYTLDNNKIIVEVAVIFAEYYEKDYMIYPNVDNNEDVDTVTFDEFKTFDIDLENGIYSRYKYTFNYVSGEFLFETVGLVETE